MVTTRLRPKSEDIDTSAPAAAYVNIPLAQWTYPKARHRFEREPDKVEGRRIGAERNRTGAWMGQIEEVNLRKEKRREMRATCTATEATGDWKY